MRDHLRVANWILACLVLHNFLSLRDEEDDWLAEAIAKAIREDQPDLEEAQTQDEVELESSQAIIPYFFCRDMFIVGEYVLLHFVDPICWPAS